MYPAQGRAFGTLIPNPKAEIPKQVRDDKKTRAEPSCLVLVFLLRLIHSLNHRALGL